MTLSSYKFTHNLGRASGSTADADAIVDQVNFSLAASGDSICKNRARDLIDSMASDEVRALYGIELVETPVEPEEA